MATTVTEDAVAPSEVARRRSTRARRVLWVVIAVVIAALVIGYVAYMALGMPGMDHTAPPGGPIYGVGDDLAGTPALVGGAVEADAVVEVHGLGEQAEGCVARRLQLRYVVDVGA